MIGKEHAGYSGVILKSNHMRLLPLLVLVLSFTACAAPMKSHTVQITKTSGAVEDMIRSVKCATQHAGWSITYADGESVIAVKSFSLNPSHYTLNIILDKPSGQTVTATFTISNPNGVIGEGDYYTRGVINALQGCGAKGLLIKP